MYEAANICRRALYAKESVMKRKLGLLVVLACVLTLGIVFISCSGSGDDGGGGGGGLPQAGNGSLSGGNTPAIPGGNVPGTLTTAYSGSGFEAASLIVNDNPRQFLSDVFDGGITVTVVSGSSVIFSLKEPEDIFKYDWTEWPMWPPEVLSDLSVTPSDAQGFGISSFLEDNTKTCKELGLIKDDGSNISFVWVDKDVTVTYGPADVEEWSLSINLVLKAGWNTIIEKWTDSEITVVSGSASGSHWAIRDQED